MTGLFINFLSVFLCVAISYTHFVKRVRLTFSWFELGSYYSKKSNKNFQWPPVEVQNLEIFRRLCSASLYADAKL